MFGLMFIQTPHATTSKRKTHTHIPARDIITNYLCNVMRSPDVLIHIHINRLYHNILTREHIIH